MTSLHPDISLVAGTDLIVPGTLLDVDGQPLDLTDAQLEWILADPNGSGSAPKPKSGWAVGREHAAGTSVAAA